MFGSNSSRRPERDPGSTSSPRTSIFPNSIIKQREHNIASLSATAFNNTNHDRESQGVIDIFTELVSARHTHHDTPARPGPGARAHGSEDRIAFVAGPNNNSNRCVVQPQRQAGTPTYQRRTTRAAIPDVAFARCATRCIQRRSSVDRGRAHENAGAPATRDAKGTRARRIPFRDIQPRTTVHNRSQPFTWAV
jgi:hypothetical protein